MGSTTASRSADRVIFLEDTTATALELTGAKAANLAKAASAGLPVLPGFVIPVTSGTAITKEPLLRSAWDRLSAGGRVPLVVRSSSVIEDGSTSSMAGVFTSVTDVNGWEAFERAVSTVLRSADGVGMAVLVQPYLAADQAGVLFGADPVSGRTDRMRVAVVDGQPSDLVSGQVSGAELTLTPRGHLRDRRRGERPMSRTRRRALARLARRTARTFGGPQDIEWAVDGDGRLWLLQARPITTPTGRADGPVLGPGPVAETFPDPLARLEEDLWLPPLRRAIAEALTLTGAASQRRIRRSPIVTSVAGRVAADLELLAGERPHGFFARLDPRGPARRLMAAWRVGRLQAALPGLAADVITGADDALGSVPALSTLSTAQLLSILERSQTMLTALHGHEILAGMLFSSRASRRDLHSDHSVTGASVALRLLAEGRAAGLTDDEIVVRHPAVLALVPPTIGGSGELPSTPSLGDLPRVPYVTVAADDLGMLREALRMRVRWVHELTSRVAVALGGHLAEMSLLAPDTAVRDVAFDALADAVTSGVPVALQPQPRPATGGQLSAAFRVRADGSIVPVGKPAATNGQRGAGGGRGTGVVHNGTGPPPRGAVLVVRTLDPNLAAWLPGLAGLVAETGSVLSHLAILAREMGVPTVVNAPDAVTRFPAGTVVTVDGSTGEVSGSTDMAVAS